MTTRGNFHLLLTNSKIPTTYHNATLNNYQLIPQLPNQIHIVETIKRYLEKFQKTKKYKCETSYTNYKYSGSQSLVFFGDSGTGKTRLACTIANELMFHKNIHFRYVLMEEILRDFERAFNFKNPESEQDIIDEYTYQDCLVIDELGASMAPEKEANALYKIFNNRINMSKPSILISNLNMEEFNAFFGKRISDRLQLAATFCFNWPSLRNLENRRKFLAKKNIKQPN